MYGTNKCQQHKIAIKTHTFTATIQNAGGGEAFVKKEPRVFDELIHGKQTRKESPPVTFSHRRAFFFFLSIGCSLFWRGSFVLSVNRVIQNPLR